MGSKAHIAVIGAGVFGAWTAHHLLRAGHRVTLVDQLGPAHSRASSGGESRLIRAAYGKDAIYTRMALDSLAQWQALSAISGRPIFIPAGILFFFQKEESYLTDSVAAHRQLNLPSELLTSNEMKRRFPMIDFDGVEAGLFEPSFGALMARRAVQSLVEQFVRDGGAYLRGAALPPARSSQSLDAVELTSGERIQADRFVFALGPWLPKAFPDLMAPRIRTPLGYVHYFGTPPGNDRFTFPNMPSFNFPGVTGWPALPPDNRGFRVRLRGDIATDPDASQRVFDREKDKLARDFVRQRFPLLLGAPLLETRACHYEMSASRNFIIDRHPQFDNVWFAGGGSAGVGDVSGAGDRRRGDVECRAAVDQADGGAADDHDSARHRVRAVPAGLTRDISRHIRKGSI